MRFRCVYSGASGRKDLYWHLQNRPWLSKKAVVLACATSPKCAYHDQCLVKNSEYLDAWKHQAPEIVMLFIMIGWLGQSSLVGTFVILTRGSRSALPTTFPNTGCFESPGPNQSKKSLCTTLMKNCDPPVLGAPVLAIESVPGSFESFEMSSSLMLPPLNRFSIAPVFKFLNSPSGGPPVPARRLLGSLA